MILKVQVQRNGELMVSTRVTVGHGLTHRNTVRNVSRETFPEVVAIMVGRVAGLRGALKEALRVAGLPELVKE